MPKSAETSWSQKEWCNKPTKLQFQSMFMLMFIFCNSMTTTRISTIGHLLLFKTNNCIHSIQETLRNTNYIYHCSYTEISRYIHIIYDTKWLIANNIVYFRIIRIWKRPWCLSKEWTGDSPMAELHVTTLWWTRQSKIGHNKLIWEPETSKWLRK